MVHHELAEGIAGQSVSRDTVWGPLLRVPVRQGGPDHSHCHLTVCIPLGCEPRDSPEMSSVYYWPQYHSHGGESSLFLNQNPPNPSCFSKPLHGSFVSSWPLELLTNKAGCILWHCPPAAMPDQAGREKGGSVPRPPIKTPDVLAVPGQEWHPFPVAESLDSHSWGCEPLGTLQPYLRAGSAPASSSRHTASALPARAAT